MKITSKCIHKCSHTTIDHFKKWITTWKLCGTTKCCMFENMRNTCIIFWCCLKSNTLKNFVSLIFNNFIYFPNLQTLFLCSRSICKCWQPVSLCWSLIAVNWNSGTGVTYKRIISKEEIFWIDFISYFFDNITMQFISNSKWICRCFISCRRLLKSTIERQSRWIYDSVLQKEKHVEMSEKKRLN